MNTKHKTAIILILLMICLAGGILFYSSNKKIENKEIVTIKEKSKKEFLETEKKYQETKETEEKKEEKICIDPGHQLKGNSETEEIAPGSSQKKAKVADGAIGIATKKNEYELTLEIGLKLRDILKNRGYEVFMIRETNNVNISNKERALMTNKAGCSVYIRLHADSSESSKTNGVSMLTSSSKNPYTKNIQKSSEDFSKIVLSEYVKTTGFKNRGISYRDDLTGTNWATTTNTLIEMGFLSNPEEDKKMSMPEFQNIMAEGIANGIEKYLKIKK